MKEKYKIIQERRVSVTNSFCYGAFYLLEIGGICLMSMKQMTIKEIKTDKDAVCARNCYKRYGRRVSCG